MPLALKPAPKRSRALLGVPDGDPYREFRELVIVTVEYRQFILDTSRNRVLLGDVHRLQQRWRRP